jgi:hypothetical protein
MSRPPRPRGCANCPAGGARQTPSTPPQPPDPTIPSSRSRPHPLLLRPADRRRRQGPAAADAGALRALLDPRRLPRHAQEPAEHTERKINYKNKGVDRPRSFRDDQLHRGNTIRAPTGSRIGIAADISPWLRLDARPVGPVVLPRLRANPQQTHSVRTHLRTPTGLGLHRIRRGAHHRGLDSPNPASRMVNGSAEECCLPLSRRLALACVPRRMRPRPFGEEFEVVLVAASPDRGRQFICNFPRKPGQVAAGRVWSLSRPSRPTPVPGLAKRHPRR